MGALRGWWNARVARMRELLTVASLLRHGGWLTAVSLALSAFGAFIPIARTLAIGNLVGSAAAVAAGHPRRDALGSLSGSLALLAGVFIVQQVPFIVSGPVSTIQGRRIDGHLRDRVRAAMLRPRGVQHLDNPRIQDDIMKALYGGGSFSVSNGAMGIGTLAASYVTVGGTFVMAATFSPFLAVGIFIVCAYLRRRLSAENIEVLGIMMRGMPAARRAGYTQNILGGLQSAKELRLFRLQDWLLDRFERDQRTFMLDPRSAQNRLMLRSVGYYMLSSALYAVALGLIVVAGLRRDISIAALSIYVRAFGDLVGVAEPTGEALQLSQAVELMKGFQDIDRLTASVAEVPWGAEDPAHLPARALRFESVTFTYPRSEVTVFEGLNLELEAGVSHAIVGLNGAGKTTLVKLLAGLYEPDSGRILVDDVPLRSLDAALWRRRIAVIFQDFAHYPLTARDNVGFGALEAIDDQAALERAAQRAGALEIIQDLPSGWDTLLTRELEDGAELSGGQWQRIALARALFAVEAGAGILVLDEPTSNLDVRAEAEIFERFLELTAGLTSIVISHRFSTVRRAQQIVVLDRGQVVERGSHADLMSAGGRYAEMFTLQASRFVAGAPSGE